MNIRKMTMIVLAAMLVTIFVGCSNKDEEDAKRISIIEEKVDALFNQEKTDIAKSIETEQFDEIDELLEAEADEEFSEENALRIESVILKLTEAFGMYEFEKLVLALVSKDGVVDEVSYLESKERVDEFKNKGLFYERQLLELEKIGNLYEQQLAQKEHVEKTEKAFNKLYKDDKLKKDVSKDDYKKVEKLVKAINDKDASLELEKRLKKLDKDMKAVAKKKEEKRLAEEKKKEEAKRTAEAQQQSSQSSNTSQSTKSNTQTNSQTASKGSGNKGSSNKSTAGNNNQSKPKQQSKPKEQPKKEQPKKEREIVMFPASSIGNSGKEFATNAEAEAWANKVYQDPNSKWYEYGWRTDAIFYGYYDESGRGVPTKTTYTVIFY